MISNHYLDSKIFEQGQNVKRSITDVTFDESLLRKMFHLILFPVSQCKDKYK